MEQNEVICRENLSWQRHKLTGPQKISFSSALERAISEGSRYRPSILHLHNLWNAVAFSVYRVARREGVPLVISPRGSLYSWSLQQGRWRKKIAWQVFMRDAMESAAVIHVTEPHEGHAVRALGVRTPLAMVPNGVELPDKHLLDFWLAQRAARGDGPRRFLFLSRVHKKKGVDLLLSAWKESLACKKGGQLVIAGPCASQEYSRYLQQMVISMDLNHSVEFIGMVRGAERERLFSEADIFVLPSHSENFGVAIAEALARGLPVITTTGTPWRVIASASAGWWIGLSVRELAEALDQAALLPSTSLLAMGSQASKIARQFGWHIQSAKMAQVYTWLAGGEVPRGVLINDGPDTNEY